MVRLWFNFNRPPKLKFITQRAADNKTTQAEERANRLAERLKALGIDPNQV